MLTHLFQLWLTIVAIGLVVFAVVTVVLDIREARARRRLKAAEAHANMFVEHRSRLGYYNGLPDPEGHMQADFEFSVLKYLYHGSK